MKTTRLGEVRLYLVADPVFMQGRSAEEVVAQAALAGVDLIQLREKLCSEEEFLCLAQKFSAILKNYSIPLIINDRVDIAKRVRAQGVHLGQSDLPWGEARRILGERSTIGVSVENLDQARLLSGSDIDYLGVSGVFETDTKTGLSSSWGWNGVMSLREECDLPLIGIGGINEENAASVIEAGADGIAVITAITRSPHPGESARRLRGIVDHALSKRTS